MFGKVGVYTSVGWISLFLYLSSLNIEIFTICVGSLNIIHFRGEIQVSKLDFFFSKLVLKFPDLVYVRTTSYLHRFSWTGFQLQFPFKSFKLFLELLFKFLIYNTCNISSLFPTNKCFLSYFLMSKHFFPTFSQPTNFFF